MQYECMYNMCVYVCVHVCVCMYACGCARVSLADMLYKENILLVRNTNTHTLTTLDNQSLSYCQGL